jgi:hypothetical protein
MAERARESEWVIERTKTRCSSLPTRHLGANDVWDLLKTFSSVISSLSSERITVSMIVTI